MGFFTYPGGLFILGSNGNKNATPSELQEWENIFNPNATPDKLSDRDLNRTGNIVAFGPVAQEYSDIESLLLVLYFAKSMKTPEGQKHVKEIIVKYLDTMGNVINAMQKASSSNVLTAILNQYACTNIYARIGLITPFDQIQTKIFLDHYLGELLKLSYVGECVQGLTTLVDATSMSTSTPTTKSDYAGLATLAKVLSGK